MSEVMWVEKYRPRSLNEMVNQESIVSLLGEMLKARDIPHFLFVGPPGTGKTAAILAFTRELYGKNYGASCLELNASDERGIDVIRINVKNFARTQSLIEVPFKMIILDEADHLTSEAQHALRRTMEIYARTCRFCLICNYGSRIIPPIQSRCAIFRFTPLSNEDMNERLIYITAKEEVHLTDMGGKAILEVARGDMRKAINTLQAAASFGKEVTYNSVYDVVGKIKPGDVQKILNLALEKEFIKARNVLRKLLIGEGISETDILREFHRIILNSNIEEKDKIQMIEALADADYRIASGADPEIQLSALLAHLALIGSDLRIA